MADPIRGAQYSQHHFDVSTHQMSKLLHATKKGHPQVFSEFDKAVNQFLEADQAYRNHPSNQNKEALSHAVRELDFAFKAVKHVVEQTAAKGIELKEILEEIITHLSNTHLDSKDQMQSAALAGGVADKVSRPNSVFTPMAKEEAEKVSDAADGFSKGQVTDLALIQSLQQLYKTL